MTTRPCFSYQRRHMTSRDRRGKAEPCAIIAPCQKPHVARGTTAATIAMSTARDPTRVVPAWRRREAATRRTSRTRSARSERTRGAFFARVARPRRRLGHDSNRAAQCSAHESERSRCFGVRHDDQRRARTLMAITYFGASCMTGDPSVPHLTSTFATRISSAPVPTGWKVTARRPMET
jgi:hypothetical protein